MNSLIQLVDSHVHLDYDSYDTDRLEMLERAKQAGVTQFLNIALGPEKEKWERSFKLFESYSNIFFAVGIHPHDVEKATPESYEYLGELSKHPKVLAIGEIGLDFYYEHSPRSLQIEWFEKLLKLAKERNLPVSIHTRDASIETIQILSQTHVFDSIGGVLHCFTGTQEEADQYLKLGAYISFSGIITFKKAESLRAVAKRVPLDRILIETDAPFLAPEPFRGKRNESAYVARVAETIAAVKGTDTRTIAQATTENFNRLFLKSR